MFNKITKIWFAIILFFFLKKNYFITVAVIIIGKERERERSISSPRAKMMGPQGTA